MTMIHLVRTDAVVAGNSHDVGRRIPKSTTGKVELGLECGKGPVLLGTQFGPGFHAPAQHRACHDLFAAADESHRITRHGPGRVDDHGFDGDIGFAAEAATQVGNVNPHMGVGNLKHVRHDLLEHKGALRTGPDFHMVLSMPSANHAVGFQCGMGAQWKIELALHRHVGLL